jgi:uncharacterized repeat protein (TIGR03803 family)
MTTPCAWRKVCAVLVICTATAVATTAQVFTTLVDFAGLNGASPFYMSLTQGRDGHIYGTTQMGGEMGFGTVFNINTRGLLTTLYAFCTDYDCLDGARADAGLILATDGNFYGTTAGGGFANSGTIFRITPGGKLTTLHSFCSQADCPDGYFPTGTLLEGWDGNLYGTTEEGGSENLGTIFRVTPTGRFTTIHSFVGAPTEGSNPYAGLIQASDGNFYGTTVEGGSTDGGTVFRISSTGELTTLHNFSGGDGLEPADALVQGADGDFYGTTELGGENGNGTVFKFTASGTLTTLYSFCGQPSCYDGSLPFGKLIQATDGTFYGTTYGGGNKGGYGTVFNVTSYGTLSTLHSFDNSDGAYPIGGLLQATNGVFFGATYFGGTFPCAGEECGTIFSLNTGLAPFVTFVRAAGKVGQTGGILGQGFTGTSSVLLNRTPASFTVVSDTFIKATVPAEATTGYVTVITPSGTLSSNVPFHVLP